MLWLNVAQTLLSRGEYVTSAGERWIWIDVPNFRRTSFPSANQFVSSWGRVMKNSGDITSATNDYLKVSIPTCGKDLGAPGFSTNYALHTVVAYTFLGPPPTNEHTVDHINRNHFDNQIGNLRWASPVEQLNNRERLKVLVNYNGETFTNLNRLATVTGKRTTALRGMVKKDDNSLFEIVKKAKLAMRPVTSVKPRVQTKVSRSAEVFDLFVNQCLSTVTIVERTGLKIATVVSYIIKEAKEGSDAQRKAAFKRLGLVETAPQEVARRVEAFKESTPLPKDWPPAYSRLYLEPCVGACPPLEGDEYRVVQALYRTCGTCGTCETTAQPTS
jgi:hypothetical protein